MTQLTTLSTARLRLRPWTEADLGPFAAMNADPRVMRHMPGVLGPEESNAMAARVRGHFEEHGWGLWAVEVAGGEPFIGFVGLMHVPFSARRSAARLRAARASRGDLDDGVGQRALVARDGAAGHDAHARRRLRPPASARGASLAAPRPLPAARYRSVIL